MNNNDTEQKLNKTTYDEQSGYFDYKKAQQHAKNIETMISEIEKQLDVDININSLKNINENILKEIPEESGKKLFEKANLLKIEIITRDALLLLKQTNYLKNNLHLKDNLNNLLQDIYQNTIEILILIKKSNYILQTIKNCIIKTLILQENQHLSEELNRQQDTEKEEQFILETKYINKIFNALHNFISMKKDIFLKQQIKNTDYEIPKVLEQKIKETDQLLISITAAAINETQKLHNIDQAKSATLQAKTNKEVLMQNIKTLYEIHNITQELIKTMWEYNETHKIHQISIYQAFYQTICSEIQDMLELITIADNVSDKIKDKAYTIYIILIIKEKCAAIKTTNSDKKIIQNKTSLEKTLETINEEVDIKKLEEIKNDAVNILKWNIECLNEECMSSSSVSRYREKSINVIKNDIQNIEQIYKNYCDYKETQKQKNQDTLQTTDSEQEKAGEAIAPETLIGDSEQEKAREAIAIMPETKLSDITMEKASSVLQGSELYL